MKATGVVRRIDELGRIVIPKEIRKNFRIKEGENIEIYIDDDNIILKKYSLLKNITDITSIIIDSVFSTTNKNLIITDNSNVIGTSPSFKKDYLNKEISNEYQEMMLKRENIIQKTIKKLNITDELIDYSYIMTPLIINGDLVGSVCLLSDEIITNSDISIMKVIVKILSKYIEE